jgi:hypothetical protein
MIKGISVMVSKPTDRLPVAIRPGSRLDSSRHG